MGTFQEFLQWSLTQSSSPNGPTIHQMAALSSYSRDSLIVQRTSQIFNPTIYEHQADMVLSSKTPPMDYNFNYVYGPFFQGNNNHSGVGEEVIDDDDDDDDEDESDSHDDEDDETSSMDADNDNSRGFGTSNSSSKNETLDLALSTPNTPTNDRGLKKNGSIRKSQRIIARRSKDATDKQPTTPTPDEKVTNISKVANAKKVSNLKTPKEAPIKTVVTGGKANRNSLSSNKSSSPNLSKSSLKTPPSPLKKVAKGYATRSRASTNDESSLNSSNSSLQTSPIPSASNKAAVNGKTDRRNSIATNESLNNSSFKTPSSSPPKATRRSTRVRKVPPKPDAYFSPKLSEPDDDVDDEEEKEITNQTIDNNENPKKEMVTFNPSVNITSAMLKSFPSSEFTDLRLSNKQPSSDKISPNETTSKSLLEKNKFKHPTKPIRIEKIVGPQLLPNGSFPSKSIEEDPTQPLEFWFKSNLNHPFPTLKEFSNLQYITGLGHLHIQQWFQSRRKVFCKLNPRNRPWKKQQQQPHIIPAKRPHSNSAADEHNSSNNDENNLESIETPEKIPKNEVSEL